MSDEKTDPRVPRAYVDTNLVSAIRRQDRGNEQKPLNLLLDAHENEEVMLVTSPVTKRELSRLTPERYAADEETYRRLGELPEIEPAPLMMLQPISARPGPRGPLPIRVPAFGFLEDLLKDRPDAEHVFQAYANKVDYFVTADERTILIHKAEVERELGIRLRLPSEVVAELGLWSA